MVYLKAVLRLGAFVALFAEIMRSNAFAGITDHVLVVRNGNSPVSRAVADDYINRRGIRHVLTIACQDAAPNLDSRERIIKLRGILEERGYTITDASLLYAAVDIEAETISFSAYQTSIERPVRDFLANHPGIDFIVLTKGIPIRITGASTSAGTMTQYAVDSRLAAMDYDKIPTAVRVDFTGPEYFAESYGKVGKEFHAQAWANRFWNSLEPFSHQQFGGYLVTRLDGYSESDAKALTTRSLQAEQASLAGRIPRGEILFDAAPKFGFSKTAAQPRSIVPDHRAFGELVRVTKESDLAEFNSDMEHAAERLKSRKIPVDIDMGTQFVGNRIQLMGYMSWGSNDPEFSPLAYRSLKFAPGAIADTAVSSSGRTFLPTPAGQSLIADLISQGLSGGKGYTDEPLLQAVASPSILFDRYTRGWTMAESFYAASALLGWQDIVIGDPLMRAYPHVRNIN